MARHHTKDPMIESLDRNIVKLFDQIGGFYIELGANDGIVQSNTALLEIERGWTGILIEPSKEAYVKCLFNRPNNIVLNCACVASDYQSNAISGDFDGELMCSVGGERLHRAAAVQVRALTLTQVLDQHLSVGKTIDFLSLDVEGYELNVLRGLDFSKYRPTWILIEIYLKELEEISKLMESNSYALYGNMTNFNHQDYPNWDGTHNDYLYIDTLTQT